MSRTPVVFFVLLATAMAIAARAFAIADMGDASKQVPVIDGGAGPCSLQLTVLGPDGKPMYDAKVKVHINYGFGGFHKLDLEAGTNADGKLKFTGLPERVRRPPLEFNASKDDLQGQAIYDPATECEGKHDISMSKSTAPAQ